MATCERSRTTCPSLRITHIYAATSPMPTEATFFAMINSLCCQLLAAQLDWSHADRHASLRCTRPRAARHQRTSAPTVRICTRSGTESILGWVDQNGGSFCAAATGVDYALLSPSVCYFGCGLLGVAPLWLATKAGKGRPQRAIGTRTHHP